MTLDGRVAVVTGGARGIGFATAARLTTAGATCALLDLNDDLAQAAAAGLDRATAWHCDVADRLRVRATVRRIEASVGPIDILINNAGIWRHTPVLEARETEWDRVHAINVKGNLFCAQAVAPGMMARRAGKIVNVASLAGFVGGAYWSAYDASKAAAISLTLALAEALAPHNVHVNAVCPGAVDTALTDAILEREPDVEFDHVHHPDDVAKEVLELVSPFEQSTSGRIVPMRAVHSVLGIAVG